MVVDRRVLLLVLRGASIFSLALFVTWLALPSPIGSAAWIPSPAPALDGPYWANDVLSRSERRFADLPGVDDVVFDDSGRGYASVADGRVVRLEGNTVVEVVNTGGRPMGLALSPTDGLLYVCDADRGLLSVDVQRKAVNVLVDTAEGDPFRFVNDIAIDRRGVVYFTDASAVWNKDQLLEDVLDQRPTGRVLRYEPATKTTTVLARELAGAAGLALAADERSLFVAEAARYRLWRLWLDGDQRNLKEVFVENLPGFPDNLALSPRGTLWVPLSSTRKRVLDVMHPHPFLKDATASLPPWLRPSFVYQGFVIEFDVEGTPLRSLQDVNAQQVASVSAVAERSDGSLWLADARGRGIAVLPSLPSTTASPTAVPAPTP
jgi:sugar lactone lactonase YvrE